MNARGYVISWRGRGWWWWWRSWHHRFLAWWMNFRSTLCIIKCRSCSRTWRSPVYAVLLKHWNIYIKTHSCGVCGGWLVEAASAGPVRLDSGSGEAKHLLHVEWSVCTGKTSRLHTMNRCTPPPLGPWTGGDHRGPSSHRGRLKQ